MHSVESLRWTSRAGVCDELCQFLAQTCSIPIRRRDYTRPALVPARSDVARLLALIADDAAVPELQWLVSNAAEDQAIRTTALQALARLQAEVPLPELQQWLDDRSLWQEPLDYCYLTDLISLCRTVEARQVVNSFLADWPAYERARLLLDCLMVRRAAVPREIVTFLYDPWGRSDHEMLEGVTVPCYDPALLNVEIAWRSADRPRSRALLVARWRQAEGDARHDALRVLTKAIGELPASMARDGEELHELANALVLPHAALGEYFGARDLLSLLEQKVRTADPHLHSQTSKCPPRVWFELLRTFSLVRSWPDSAVDDRLACWIGCPDLSPRLRGEWLRGLWARNRDRAAAVLRLAQANEEFMPVVRRFMAMDGHRLRASEREFLDWATAQEAEPLIRYAAAQAWDHLNDDSLAWRRRLEGFTRGDDPYLRLRALASLSRRGDSARLAEIIETASSADHVCERAEALRILGELDASRHRALLHRALMEPKTAVCESGRAGRMAAFHEADRALMRLDQAEALTEVIQGYLALPGLHNPHQFKEVIEALMSGGEVTLSRYPVFDTRWGRCRGERAQDDWQDLLDTERRFGIRPQANSAVSSAAGLG
jgi:hypothetical protein